MGKKRTLAQRRFIDAYVKFEGNATAAYLSLHPDCKKTSAADLGYRMLRKVDITIKEILDKIGVTDTYLSQKLNEGLEATKTISVIPLIAKEAKENSTDLPKANSKNIEFVDVDDFAVRQRYLDMAFKLKDKYPSEKHKLEVEGEIKIKVKLPKDDRS